MNVYSKLWGLLRPQCRRFAYSAHTQQYGNELETLLGRCADSGIRESQLRRMVRDALLVSPYITEVYGFSVLQSGSTDEGTFADDILRACAGGMSKLWSMEIDGMENRAFVSTATGDYLTAVCADRGVERREGEDDDSLRQGVEQHEARWLLAQADAEGLSRWEADFGLPDWLGVDLERRRSRLLPLPFEVGTLTPRWLAELAVTVCGAEEDEVENHFSEWRAELIVFCPDKCMRRNSCGSSAVPWTGFSPPSWKCRSCPECYSRACSTMH